MVTTPAYLLSPFVPLVHRYLEDNAWQRTVYGRPQNKLSVVCAGVGGEPLYRLVLVEAGMTNEELLKIGEFYEFYEF